MLMSKKPTISVVLNVYRRSKHFKDQLEAIENQSVKADEVLVWENGTESVPVEFRPRVTIARATENLGVWARFAFALNAKSEYVCVLDDDTIPGSRWFENCLKTMQTKPGLMGTRGLIFDNPGNYSINRERGVYGPSANPERVDIVGHAWFFKRSWLSVFWAEYSNRFDYPLAGEDMHFSYAMQKHLGLPTVVPPHPLDDLSMWGSQPDTSLELGQQEAAISRGKKSMEIFEKALQHYRSQGFRVMCEEDISEGKFHSKYPKIVYWAASRLPGLAHTLGKSEITQKVLRSISRF